MLHLSKVLAMQSPSNDEPKSDGPAVPPPTDVLSNFVQQAALDLVRQKSDIDFWKDSLSVSLSESRLAAWLGLPKDHSFQIRSLVAAIKRGGKSYRSFVIKVNEETKDNCHVLVVSAVLNADSEWRNAWEEAWSLSPEPNPHCLTDNALKLYRWLKSPKFDGQPIDENSLGRRANLRGSYHHIPDYLTEIQVKADPCLIFSEGRWQEPLTISFNSEPPQYYQIGPLNPPLSLSTENKNREELEKFKSWLYGVIQNTEFKRERDVIGVFDIGDRKTLKCCFSDWPEGVGFGYRLEEFFDEVRLVPGLELAYQFEDGLSHWLVVARVQKGSTWKTIQERIREKITAIPVQKKYDLSPDSSALLTWILDLRPEEFLSSLTPAVEDCLETDIGITVEWPKENLPAYIELLVEEINEKTEFDLRTQRWKDYSREQTRIRVKKKALELETLIRSLQLFGLTKDRPLEEAEVRETIEKLLDARKASVSRSSE